MKKVIGVGLMAVSAPAFAGSFCKIITPKDASTYSKFRVHGVTLEQCRNIADQEYAKVPQDLKFESTVIEYEDEDGNVTTKTKMVIKR